MSFDIDRIHEAALQEDFDRAVSMINTGTITVNVSIGHDEILVTNDNDDEREQRDALEEEAIAQLPETVRALLTDLDAMQNRLDDSQLDDDHCDLYNTIAERVRNFVLYGSVSVGRAITALPANGRDFFSDTHETLWSRAAPRVLVGTNPDGLAYLANQSDSIFCWTYGGSRCFVNPGWYVIRRPDSVMSVAAGEIAGHVVVASPTPVALVRPEDKTVNQIVLAEFKLVAHRYGFYHFSVVSDGEVRVEYDGEQYNHGWMEVGGTFSMNDRGQHDVAALPHVPATPQLNLEANPPRTRRGLLSK